MSYAERLRAALTEFDRTLLAHVAEAAVRLSAVPYLVGGPVRDCLLGGTIVDLDVAIEGEAIAVARQLARDLNGEFEPHDRFGTATVQLPTRSLDLAMTRTETYARPGALPDVTRGTIETDLIRRDFTINALALRLDADHFGELVDKHGGERDLHERVLRVLHSQSFSDDPTRLFRVARFEQRFDFSIASSTLQLIPAALPVLDAISGDRLRHEFELIFREARPIKALTRLNEWRVLHQIDPALKIDDVIVARFATQIGPLDSFTGWAWMLAQLPITELRRITTRLNLLRDDARDLEALHNLWAAAEPIGQATKRSAIYHQLERYPDRVLDAALTLIDDRAVCSNIELFRRDLHDITPALNGSDLIALGQAAGPALGRLLEKLRDARLDGQVQARAEEERYARQIIARGNDDDGA